MTRLTIERHCRSFAVSLLILTMYFSQTNAVHADQQAYDFLSVIANAGRSSDDLFMTIAQIDRGVYDPIPADSLENESPHPDEAQNDEEIHCLALNIYFEARSEPEQGQLAVGHVVMNRVASRHYPDSVCEVVKQGGEEQLNRCQFSWWCDGRSDKPMNKTAWRNAMQLAETVYAGDTEDPTNGALWYHADYVNPYWSGRLTLVTKIGQHIFYL